MLVLQDCTCALCLYPALLLILETSSPYTIPIEASLCAVQWTRKALLHSRQQPRLGGDSCN